MTYQEAIEKIEHRYMTASMCINPEECRAENEAISMAVFAMEKQTPKKPKLYRRSYWCFDCEGRITVGKKYCGNCGKAIDWSDEE